MSKQREIKKADAVTATSTKKLNKPNEYNKNRSKPVNSELKKFARKNCAYYSLTPSHCPLTWVSPDKPYYDLLKVSPGDCLIVNGHHCKYFRENVLPPANYRFFKDQKMLARLRAEYAKIDPKFTADDLLKSNIRLCPDCNKNRLKKYRRFCDDCRDKRKKLSQKKKRNKRGEGKT